MVAIGLVDFEALADGIFARNCAYFKGQFPDASQVERTWGVSSVLGPFSPSIFNFSNKYSKLGFEGLKTKFGPKLS